MEPKEFEDKWKEVLSDFGLDDHVWLKGMFAIRDEWVPAYFRGVHMGCLLRTTQRSKSANSFFKVFENRYGTLVEFWMSFVSAMEQQRHTQKRLELECIDSMPQKIGDLFREDHAIRMYTHEAFYDFQRESKFSNSSCSVAGYSITGELEITTVIDATRDKRYQVQYNDHNNDASCSCKLYSKRGFLCRHISWLYTGKRLKAIPEMYIEKRWTKGALRRPIYDMEGNLLTRYDKTDVKKIAMCKVWEEIYSIVGVVATKEINYKNSLVNILNNFPAKLEPTKQPITKQHEIEMLLGCTLLTKVNIFLPTQANNKGMRKRLVSKKNEAIESAKKEKRSHRV